MELKKLSSLALIIALMLTLAACGGNSEPSSTPASSSAVASSTPASTVESTPSKPASTPASTTKHDTDKMEEEFTEAYMGQLVDSGETIYFAGASDGSLAMIMFLDPETEQHYVFVGPLEENDDDTFTITDEIDGLTLTFEAEENDEGLWFDFGEELGEAVLEECTVEEAIDAILSIEASTSNVLDNDEDSDVFSSDFSIINNTGFDVYALYISPSDADDWQEDVLGDLVLEDGETLEITFELSDNDNYYDLKLEDESGEYLVWAELDLISFSEIELLIEDGEAIANLK